MSTTKQGRYAEDLVAKELSKRGHKILVQNWRTRWCEIDIVSSKDKVVYFTEVKYRGSNDWGDGLSYITSAKQRQMEFAAENWLHINNWKHESQLIAVSVDKENNIEIIEI